MSLFPFKRRIKKWNENFHYFSYFLPWWLPSAWPCSTCCPWPWSAPPTWRSARGCGGQGRPLARRTWRGTRNISSTGGKSSGCWWWWSSSSPSAGCPTTSTSLSACGGQTLTTTNTSTSSSSSRTGSPWATAATTPSYIACAAPCSDTTSAPSCGGVTAPSRGGTARRRQPTQTYSVYKSPYCDDTHLVFYFLTSMNNEDDKYRYKLFLESTLKIMFQFFLNDSLRRGRWSNKEKFSRESLITCRAWHSTRPLTTSAGWYRPRLAQINLNLFFDLSSLWFYDFKLLADIPISPIIEPHKAKSISIHLYTLYDIWLSSLIYPPFNFTTSNFTTNQWYSILVINIL